MIPSTPWPPTHTEYDQAESESNQADVGYKEREQKIQNQTPLDASAVDVEMENREWELKRDFNTPLGGTYLVSWIIVFLLVIGILVLLSNFHP